MVRYMQTMCSQVLYCRTHSQAKSTTLHCVVSFRIKWWRPVTRLQVCAYCRQSLGMSTVLNSTTHNTRSHWYNYCTALTQLFCTLYSKHTCTVRTCTCVIRTCTCIMQVALFQLALVFTTSIYCTCFEHSLDLFGHTYSAKLRVVVGRY